MRGPRRSQAKLMKIVGAVTLCFCCFIATVNIVKHNQVSQLDTQRSLAINLGGGDCLWTPPEPWNSTDTLNTTTLLVGYPGSGKRLAWKFLEALTGKVTGDDWDISKNGWDSVLNIKTSYPHHESHIWSWDSYMDQTIMIVRNPRYALPSYHTMRRELDWSDSWGYSYIRQYWTYSERAPIAEWNVWRDQRFNEEIENFSDFVHFWMQDGMYKNGTTPNQDWHCFHHLLDCTPKTVLKFENLIGLEGNETAYQEMEKMARVLDAAPHINVIPIEARPCVFREVERRPWMYNPRRDATNGPTSDLKKFSLAQLIKMKSVLVNLKLFYTKEPWASKQIAIDLVAALTTYIDEVEKEYQIDLALQEKS